MRRFPRSFRLSLGDRCARWCRRPSCSRCERRLPTAWKIRRPGSGPNPCPCQAPWWCRRVRMRAPAPRCSCRNQYRLQKAPRTRQRPNQSRWCPPWSHSPLQSSDAPIRSSRRVHWLTGSTRWPRIAPHQHCMSKDPLAGVAQPRRPRRLFFGRAEKYRAEVG